MYSKKRENTKVSKADLTSEVELEVVMGLRDCKKEEKGV